MTVTLERYQIKRPALTVIQSDAQNDEYIAALLELEKQPHLSADDRKYANLLAVLIENYEKEHHPIADVSPLAVLTELMTANNLRQKDLASIFGGESVVSEVLNGKRQLNKQQIERLSKRFAVSPAVFFPKSARTAAR